jgi:hypothetical protein
VLEEVTPAIVCKVIALQLAEVPRISVLIATLQLGEEIGHGEDDVEMSTSLVLMVDDE